MNAAASAGSSCAISSSIFAQIGTARVARARQERLRARRARPRRSALRQIRLVEVEHEEQRLGREELKAAQPLRIVAGELERAQRLARPRAPRGSGRRISCSFFSSGVPPFFRSRSSRSSRRSTTPRSARMTSSSIARTSRAGSTEPAGCGTDGSRNMRTTCSSASALRNGATSSSACGAGLRAPPTPRDVGEFDRRGHVLARVEERRQLVEALVGHARDADVRVRLAGCPRAALRARSSGAGRARSCPTTEIQ